MSPKSQNELIGIVKKYITQKWVVYMYICIYAYCVSICVFVYVYIIYIYINK